MSKNVSLSDHNLANLEAMLNEPAWKDTTLGMLLGAAGGSAIGPLLQLLGVINPYYNSFSTMGIGAGTGAALGGLLAYISKLYFDRNILKQLRDYERNKADKESIGNLKFMSSIYDLAKEYGGS
jgi:hypothetical protein